MPKLRFQPGELPEITLAGRFPLDSGLTPKPYVHPTWALHLHDYSGLFESGKSGPLALEPGDLTLSAPYTPSRYDLPAGGFHLCAHFHYSVKQGRGTAVPVHFRPGLRGAYFRQRFLALIHYIQLAGRKPHSSERLAASAVLYEILLGMCIYANDSGGIQLATALDRLPSVIEHRLAQPIMIPELARELGLSQNYLASHFRRRFGVSITRYILMRRIEMAQHLLATTQLPMKAIAARVGLGDPHYFNKRFRSVTGRSPRGFRATLNSRPSS